MNTIIIEFHIHELNRNIGILTSKGNLEKAEELKKDLASYEQQLCDANWQALEERVGLKSLERNA
jgi:DNA replication protein DnaD